MAILEEVLCSMIEKLDQEEFSDEFLRSLADELGKGGAANSEAIVNLIEDKTEHKWTERNSDDAPEG